MNAYFCQRVWGGLSLLALFALSGGGVAVAAGSSLYQQKAAVVDRFLEQSGTAKRVAAPGHTDAEALLAAARAKRDAAQQAHAAGEEQQALDLLSQAIKLASEASRKSADRASQEWLHRTRYDDLSDSLQFLRESYRKHMEQADAERQKAAQQTLLEVTPLTEEAKALAGKKEYEGANRQLLRAQEMLIAGLKPLLASRSLVYTLKFDTPRQEYEYEVRRGESLEALIRMTLAEAAASRPEGGSDVTAPLVARSRERQKVAQQTAAAGDFAAAIRVQEEANTLLVQALRQLGVMIPL
ncbi:MAG: gp58-like family protein [Magnetococcus sp. YQC-3]